MASFLRATTASSLGRIYLVPRFVYQHIQESGSTVLLNVTKTFAANAALSAGNVLCPPLWHREHRQEALLDLSQSWYGSEIFRRAFGIPPCNFCASGCISVFTRKI